MPMVLLLYYVLDSSLELEHLLEQIAALFSIILVCDPEDQKAFMCFQGKSQLLGNIAT